MISDITLGQFFPGKSLIHRLDPRTKILISILFIVTVFVADNPLSFALLLASLTLITAISKISFKVVIKGLKPIIIILLITALINVFMTKGEGTPLLELGKIRVYEEGIVRAVFMALRVMVLIIGTSLLLTYTTSPISLTDGLESLLTPLKRIGVPVHTFAMMMSIALRFIPTLIEETEKIMNAQKSRGADFTSGGLVKRAKALIPLLLPLIVSSFNRAEELATAMECRCYRGDNNRTKLVKLQMKGIDFVFLFIFVLLLAIMICLAILPDYFAFNSKILNIIFYQI